MQDGTATVTIRDSEHTVTAASRSNASENPPADGQIEVSLGARNASSDPLTVEYSVAGTATPAVDYIALTGISVIPVGASTTVIDVVPLDDDLQEGDETVEITLNRTSDERAPIGSPATASLTIADDDENGGNGDDDDDGNDGDDDDDSNSVVRVSVSASYRGRNLGRRRRIPGAPRRRSPDTSGDDRVLGLRKRDAGR